MRRSLLLLLLSFALSLAACADEDKSSEAPTGREFEGRSITVFAASSLTAAFTEIGETFTNETGATVTFNFGGSSDLRAQLELGAQTDVFASADTNQMVLAKAVGLVTNDGTVFARNRLVIIVPKDNSAGITRPEDLASEGLKISLAADTVPVGKYARQFLDNGSAEVSYPSGYKDAVLANVVTNASNVKEVVSAVQLDEVDAGIVYATDVTPEIEGDVTVIEIPDALNVIATYPINVTARSGSPAAAQAFVDFVVGSEGQAVLVSHGFLAPE